jgi:hypothetical protein
MIIVILKLTELRTNKLNFKKGGIMPTRDEIKPKVITKIKTISDAGDLAEDEKSHLWNDLGMGPVVKAAMSLPYSKISKKYPNGIVVSQAAAAKCETVKDSIDLVFNRANGER